MPEQDIDLERAIQDPVYRRQVIERLNAEAEQRPQNGAEGPTEADQPVEESAARH